MKHTAKGILPELYPFSPRKLQIDGHALSFIDEGEGHAVVMLHGNPTWSFYYRRLAAALRDGFRVIAPDHMGCGLSDKPQRYPYRLSTHVRNLEILLEQIGVRRFTLVVHDWGGAIGMGFAVRNPERIQQLVILNTAAFRSHRIPLRIRLCRAPLIGDMLVRGLNGFARAALFMATTKGLSPEVAKAYIHPYDTWANRVAILRFVQDIPLSENDSSWRDLLTIEQGLKQFRNTPALILWGGKDFCFNQHFFDQWQQILPQAEKHFFPDAGHYLLEDAWEDVWSHICRFLATRGSTQQHP